MRKHRIFTVLLSLLLAASLLLSVSCGKKDSGNDSEGKERSADKDNKDDDKDDNKDDNKDDGRDDPTDEPASSPDEGEKEPAVKITAAKTASIQYETYDNGLVSLEIPKGWKVEVPAVDYIHYCFKVYDPANADYMFTFNLKLEGFAKSEAAKNFYARTYPDSVSGVLSPIDPQTTEQFLKVWNRNAALANQISFGYDYFPLLNNYQTIENLGKMPLGGDLLRGSFTSDAGKPMEGLFTATVYSPGSYYNLGIDTFPLRVYHTIMMMAPEAELTDWAPVYDRCVGSVQFSQAFLNGFNEEERVLVSTVLANQRIYDEISDMIMDSWEKRNNSYDILSQKRSDATLGYERVYDTDTGDVYRAYNGFTDGYSGTRYQPVTDDMYTAPVSGYIER